MKPARRMRDVITALCTTHGVPLQFTDPDMIVKIENAPYLPLTIECVGPHQISVCHYARTGQDSELVQDPEIVFWVPPTDGVQHVAGAWYPCEITQVAMIIFGRELGGYQRLVELSDAATAWTHCVLPNQAEVADFANLWADNIAAQDFATGTVVRWATAPHQDRAA